MTNKQIQTRVVNKHDTEANWNAATDFTPLDGELIVVNTDDGHQRFKVGKFDSSKNRLLYYSELPFTDENKATITIKRWVT